MSLKSVSFIVAIICLLPYAVSVVTAVESKGEKSITETKPEKEPTAAELVKQLDHEDFLTRQLAAQKLAQMGSPTFPELIKAAKDGSLEKISQVMIILNNHYQSKDEKLSAAAKEALQKIAEGTNATSSQRAKEILKPVEKKQNQEDNFNNQLPPGFGNGNIQIQILPNGQFPGNLPVQQGIHIFQKSISNNNGEKKTTIKENGKETEITEGAAGIAVKVTENGKTTESKADNADDLKKKFPDAFKIYEEQSKENLAVNAGNIQFGNPFGGPQRIQNGLNNNPADTINESRLKSIERQLQNLTRQIEILTSRSDRNRKELKATVEKLDEARKSLETAIENLRKDENDDANNPAKRAANEVNPLEKGQPQKPAKQIIIEGEKKAEKDDK